MNTKNLLVRITVMALLFSCFLPLIQGAASANSDPYISVKLVNTVGNSTELSLEITGNYQLKEKTDTITTGSYKLRAEKNSLVLYQGSESIYRGENLTFQPVEYGESSIIKVNNRPYLGDMKFILENGLFVRPINTLLLEDYLKGVVPREMPASWELEALKAQAIAARTYAMRYVSKLVDDTINYQVYGGYQWHDKSTRAVEETRGQLLEHQGSLVETVFSSSNGGTIEASGNLWNTVVYLDAKEDPFDPQNKWSLAIRKKQLELDGKDLFNPESWWATAKEMDQPLTSAMKAWLQQNGYENHDIKVVTIKDFSVHPDRTSGNRMKTGRLSLQLLIKHPQTGFLRHPDGSIRLVDWENSNLTAASIRRIMGGGNVFKSTLVDSIHTDGNSITIQGRGFGHGIGMSQYGANEMAKQGKKVEEILAFYYPGTSLTAEVTGPTIPVPDAKPIPVTPPITIPESSGEELALLQDIKLSTETFTIGDPKGIKIEYKLNHSASVDVRAYDANGVIRRVMQSGSNQSAGLKSLQWDGYGLGKGVYTVVIEARDEQGVVSNITAKIQFIEPVISRSTSQLVRKGVIKATVKVGLRATPDLKVKPTKVLSPGNAVEVLEKKDRWYKVKHGTTIGYVPDNYVQLVK
ncbi:SpoIID/LytB domain-containing protein [Ammoniphilus sp. CFH 90114]|uniref:SpoIID/LytB domain-containing protein n=1 Tax=Ammoniphilus sp. CFH 90114 TaxID=2493665 RepID=UPI0013E91467|nr:SpoIID/LytB domain-containing protein [Ammoniphilus sp. CFH 90114]